LQNVQHLAAILSLGDHLEVLFQSEQLAETIPENRMVIRDYDPDLGI
jgi:hypothetical protein